MPRPELLARLTELYAGRPVVLAPGSAAAWASWVERLDRLGCSTLVLDLSAPPTVLTTDGLRLHDRLLRDLPPDAVAAVEAHDPQRRGVFRTTPFVTSDEPLLGRPVTGGRPRAFLALEDKTRADEVWRGAGLVTAPSRVVAAASGDLAAATEEVRGPRGAVWSGGGFSGGGDYVRWVADHDDEIRAHAFLAPRSERVRVMPFLDGVPCSIHGFVLDDGTAALRPVEIAVLRDRGARSFVYGGLSSTWDPPDPDRAHLREVARRVGEHLRATHGYRGVFGVDGVLTADGFRPTELNPRMSAGATLLTRVDADFFQLLQANLVAGVETGARVADVEELVPLMDADRRAEVVGGTTVDLPPGTRLAAYLAAREPHLEAAPDLRH